MFGCDINGASLDGFLTERREKIGLRLKKEATVTVCLMDSILIVLTDVILMCWPLFLMMMIDSLINLFGQIYSHSSVVVVFVFDFFILNLK